MQDCNFPLSFNKSSDDLTFWFHIFPSFYCKDFKWKIFSLLHTQCYFLLPFNDLNERPSLVAARVGGWCPWCVFGVMFGVLGVALGQGLVSLGWLWVPVWFWGGFGSGFGDPGVGLGQGLVSLGWLWVPVWSWGGFGLGFGGFGSEFGVSGVTLGSLLFLGWLWVVLVVSGVALGQCFWGASGIRQKSWSHQDRFSIPEALPMLFLRKLEWFCSFLFNYHCSCSAEALKWICVPVIEWGQQQRAAESWGFFSVDLK